MVKEWTDEDFAQETASGVTLTDFWATWCGPCRMQAPVVEKLAEEMAGQVKIGKVDVDKNQATAAKYGVMSIPTLLIQKDGQVVDTLIGYHDKGALKSKIRTISLINNAGATMMFCIVVAPALFI